MFESTVLILKIANVYPLIYIQLYLLLTNRSPNANICVILYPQFMLKS